MRSENHMVRTAIIALLVMLACVYLLVYSVYYPSPVSEPLSSGSGAMITGSVNRPAIVNTAQSIVTQVQETIDAISISKEETNDGDGTTPNIDLGDGTSIVSGPGLFSPSSSVATDVDESDMMLPGTTRSSARTIADTIGIDYEYVLVDNTRDIYYLYLGSQGQNFEQLLQSIDGDTVTLDTQAQLLANALFGDSVTFLNVPVFINQTVLMVITFGTDQRLIQIPYDIYHESKLYLADKFI